MPRRWMPRPVVWVSLAMLLSGLIVFSASTVTERSCTACHSTVAEQFHTVTHSGLACSDCHREQDAAGVIDLRLRLVRMLAGSLTTGAPPAQAIPSSRCLTCHETVLTDVSVAKGIRMSHEEPNTRGIPCVQCHGAEMHAGIRTSAGHIEMATCLTCHVVSAESDDCDICHAKNVSRLTPVTTGTFNKTHGPEWQSLHGMGDLNGCSSCHTATRCESCHETPIPHGPNWLNQHGEQSLSNPQVCTKCHSAAFCSDCHNAPMPHSTGFRSSHSATAKGLEDPSCHQCHAQQACDACHAAHIHPGLPAEKATALRKKAGIDE